MAIYKGTINISNQQIAVIEEQGQRVLTTEQLATAFGTTPDSVKQNFKRNKSRFEEGKHYYILEGESLQNLRVTDSHLQISSMTRKLYLWTERGAARHSKILDTDEAWAMFDILEKHYFEVQQSKAIKPMTATQMFIAAAKALEEQDQRLSVVEGSLTTMTGNVSSLTESVADINKRLDHETKVNALTDHLLDVQNRKQQKQIDQNTADIKQLKQDRFTVKEDISTDVKGFINKVFDHYPHFYEQGQKNGKAEVYRIFYGAVSEGAGHSSSYISTLISERRKRLISQGLSEATAKQKVTGITVINSDVQLRTAAMDVIKNVEDIMKAEGETNA